MFLRLLVLAQIFMGTAAYAGNEGGGGGNMRGSSAEQVRSALHLVLPFISTPYAHNDSVGTFLGIKQLSEAMSDSAVVKIRNARARQILSEIFNPTNGRFRSKVGEFQISVNWTGSCWYKFAERDSSYTGRNSANIAQICISGKRLQRFPKKAIKQEVQALILHELAHVAGFNEADAQFIQDFYIAKVLQTCAFYLHFDQPRYVGSTFELFFGTDSNDGPPLSKPFVTVQRYVEGSESGDIGNHVISSQRMSTTDFSGTYNPAIGGQFEFSYIGLDGVISKTRVRLGKANGLSVGVGNGSLKLEPFTLDGQRLRAMDSTYEVEAACFDR